MDQIKKEDNSISFDYQEIPQNILSVNPSSSSNAVLGTGQAVLGGLNGSSLSYYGTGGTIVSSPVKDELSEEQMLSEIMNRVNTLSFQLDSARNQLESTQKAFNEALKVMNALSDERKVKRRKLKTKK